MRLYCIACEVLARPLYLAAAASPHLVDLQLLPFGLHERPQELGGAVQAQVDGVEAGKYDAIVLGYGLCGNWLTSLKAGNSMLVIPKVHDCISLFLGDPYRYEQEIARTPGTYWFVQDYVERSNTGNFFTPLGSFEKTIYGLTYAECVTKYGQDNADYLFQVASTWQANYERAVWIDLGMAASDAHQMQVSEEAKKRNWRFERLTGDLFLIKALLDGVWAGGDNTHFFLVPAGQQVQLSFDASFYKLCLSGSEPCGK